MSYRTFKHLLGETSLERKCRFIFGGGILVLVTISFSWYGQKTEAWSSARPIKQARSGPRRRSRTSTSRTCSATASSPPRRRAGRRAAAPEPTSPLLVAHHRPAIPRTRRQPATTSSARPSSCSSRSPPGRRPSDPGVDRPILFQARTVPGRMQYQYVQAVFLKPNCLVGCHRTREDRARQDRLRQARRPRRRRGHHAAPRPDNRDIYRNRAILIAAAMVTAFLAMIASYVDRALRDRQAAQAPARRQRRDQPRQPRRSAPRSTRATSSRSWPRLQSHAAPSGRHAGGAARGQRQPRRQGRRAGPGQHALCSK